MTQTRSARAHHRLLPLPSVLYAAIFDLISRRTDSSSLPQTRGFHDVHRVGRTAPTRLNYSIFHTGEYAGGLAIDGKHGLRLEASLRNRFYDTLRRVYGSGKGVLFFVRLSDVTCVYNGGSETNERICF